ncbi:hypothetical protein [Nocardia sp. CC227C]|uniref:hypothetical protein n=1 Tax=Nocardia sp. CC227C TaxID=3044562 RepID=UPI00278C5FC5|nr:hypothetical protein [Nocardia sp. CC227C]
MSDDDDSPRERGTRTAFGLSLGLCLGAAYGLLTGNQAVGIGVGMALGAAAGVLSDRRAR